METDHAQVRGSASEHLAAVAFLVNGYRVYHLDNESGDSDQIIEKDGVLLRCQVKTVYSRHRKDRKMPKKVVDMRVPAHKRKGEKLTCYAEPQVFAIVDLEEREVYLVLNDRPWKQAHKSTIERLGRRLL